ncbi:MAG: hypothetical protein COT74_05230 [Bdellovibrionales bacterium CG10_big_fil_rev_8_21_14_0_10_45_34]|nr:MAG: hypothetical protein COT74_05230 [Bdellovibrionales bacterium CG10_big_fil_rev_8_21_14_0_10_45_34]
MKRVYVISIFLGLLAGALAIGFQNCSSPVRFTDQKHLPSSKAPVSDEDSNNHALDISFPAQPSDPQDSIFIGGGGNSGGDPDDDLNLGDGGGSGSVDGGSGEGPGSIGVDDGVADPDEIIKVEMNCAEAKLAGSLKTLTHRVRFDNPRDIEFPFGMPKTGDVCRFGQADNLSMKNEFIRARYEQEFDLPLEGKHELCDMKMEFNMQKMVYDDIFYFSLNDFVLASNSKTTTSALETSVIQVDGKSIEVYKYDWLGVQGKPMGDINSTADDYCVASSLGLSSCSWPLSERSGNMQVSLDRRVIIGLGILNGNSTAPSFRFVTTGDNDPSSDCQHSPIEFDVTIDYVER